MDSMYKRLFIVAIAIAYGAFCGGIPVAHALNNDLWIGLCNPCSTTLDFQRAAVFLVSASEKWHGQPWGKSYTYVAIMSNTHSSTAFISVTGYWAISARRPTFFPQTYIPVDANGNS